MVHLAVPTKLWLRTRALGEPKGKLRAEFIKLIHALFKQHMKRKKHKMHWSNMDKYFKLYLPMDQLYSALEINSYFQHRNYELWMIIPSEIKMDWEAKVQSSSMSFAISQTCDPEQVSKLD